MGRRKNTTMHGNKETDTCITTLRCPTPPNSDSTHAERLLTYAADQASKEATRAEEARQAEVCCPPTEAVHKSGSGLAPGEWSGWHAVLGSSLVVVEVLSSSTSCCEAARQLAPGSAEVHFPVAVEGPQSSKELLVALAALQRWNCT